MRTTLSLIASMVVLVVGVLVFFQVWDGIEQQLDASPKVNDSVVDETIQSITDTSDTIFSMIPVIAIVGIIMMVVGVVYSFSGGRSSYDREDSLGSSFYDTTAPTFAMPVEKPQEPIQKRKNNLSKKKSE